MISSARAPHAAVKLPAVRSISPPWMLVPVLLALSLSAAEVRGQSDPADGRRRLEQLRAEIDANRREIEQIDLQEKDLSRKQARIERDRELTNRYLRELDNQDWLLRGDLASRQVSLLEKEAAAEESARRLKESLVRYYRVRHVTGPELLFSSRSFAELFARGQFLSRMIHRERIELAALADERAVISRETHALADRRSEVARLQGEKRTEEERLRRQGAEAQVKIAELRGERSGRENRIRELEESQEAIRRMIERLERERARSEMRGEAPEFDGSLAPGRGRLPWPVRGRVTGEFGYEVNPRYGTRVPSNGIDIAAPEGTPFRAVAPGIVKFVDWLPGYGRTVILSHGSGYFTLYAHASAVDVRRGQRVETGDVLGRVGDTDSIKGPCLHFEVREGQAALDPREWLER